MSALAGILLVALPLAFLLSGIYLAPVAIAATAVPHGRLSRHVLLVAWVWGAAFWIAVAVGLQLIGAA